MRAFFRRWLPWFFLLGFGLGVWYGWVRLQRLAREFLDGEHQVAGWTVRAFGARNKGIETFQADSILVSGPSAELLVMAPRLSWFRDPVGHGHRFPFLVRLEVRLLQVFLLPTPPSEPDSSQSEEPRSRPKFPSVLRIPVALEVVLDSMELEKEGRFKLRAGGISLATVGPAGAEFSWRNLGEARAQAWADGATSLGWGEDSLLYTARIGVATPAGTRDSLSLRAALPLDATQELGEAELQLDVGSLRDWAALVPALEKTPSVDSLSIGARYRREADKGVRWEARVSTRTGSFLFIPGLDWNLSLTSTDDSTRLDLMADGVPGERIAARLSTTGDPLAALRRDGFSGVVDVQGIGYTLVGYPHPFDGSIQVKSIGSQGGEGTVRFASGSVVTGGATWKGLHWHCTGDIAPQEPWAVAWTPGLGLEGGARVVGRDTVGAALFRVVGKSPRYHVIRTDSMFAEVLLDLRSVRLPRVRFWKSDNSWSGDGVVDWNERYYRFGLLPDSRPGWARVDGDFHGGVVAETESFPAETLPVEDPRAVVPYPVSASARFQRVPPRGADSASMLLQGLLQALPGRDSLELRLSAAQSGDYFWLDSLRLLLGGSSALAKFAAERTEDGWSPRGVSSRFEHFDLLRISEIWPGLPRVLGTLDGDIEISSEDGVAAQARLEGLGLGEPGHETILPDLSVWGRKDTLHVGGWWPVAGARDPFRFTVTDILSQDIGLHLLAFHGDVVRARADGRLRERRRLEADLRLDGGIAIPGTEARWEDIFAVGRLTAAKEDTGLSWKASLEGREGLLRAVKGLPLRSRFSLRADAGGVSIDSLSLRGERSGEISVRGRYAFAEKTFIGNGRARDFKLDLGEGMRLRLDQMDMVATADRRLTADLSGVSWQQTWKDKGGLWVDVERAKLGLLQAKDWRKLQGQAQVRKLLFTRDLADPRSLASMAGDALTGQSRNDTRTRGGLDEIPLLLDVRLWGGGDSVRIANNLARASLSFDLQATGPTDAVVLSGTLDADPEGSSFGYLGKTFDLEEFHSEWNSSPLLSGRYALQGSRSILSTCPESNRQETQRGPANLDSCRLKVSSEGTLGDPRLRPLTSDCGAGGADEGAVQAAIALARDCYPEDPGSGTGTFGGAAKDAAIDIGIQLGIGQVNDVLRSELARQRRQGRVFLPDSMALTDVPIGGVRDQLGLLALYRLSDAVDAEGEYRHTFVQTASSGSSPILADDYLLRLRWRPPLAWIDEQRIAERLRNHLVVQLEFGQALDDLSQRETTLRPSLRYRWEFW